MRLTKILLGLILAGIVLGRTAQACRPLVVDDCGVIEPGRFSLEAGLSTARGAGAQDYFEFTTALIYGLYPSVDLGVEAPYLGLRLEDGSHVQGLADLTLRSKIMALDPVQAWLGLAGVFGAKLANGDAERGLGSGSVEYSITAVATKVLGPGLLHATLGYALTGEGGADRAWLYGGSFEWPLWQDLRILGEVIDTYVPDSAGTGNDPTAQAGINLGLGELVLDLGISFGLVTGSQAEVYTLGITTEL